MIFQDFLNGEHDSLLASIDMFRTLLPNKRVNGSVHSGEEGRFIELALTQYLREKLPKGIGVGSGFVVDIKSGWSSKQIDIILYDQVKYSPVMKYGDAIVVPVQSVISALSVKRKLYKKQFSNEIQSLTDIGSHAGGLGYPKPYLSIVAFDSDKKTVTNAKDDAFAAISHFYDPRTDYKSRLHYYSWNEILDSVIVFDKFIVKGTNYRPNDRKNRKESRYLWTGGDGVKRNLYIQHLLNGIYRAWYDTRRGGSSPGELLHIPSGGMQSLGTVKFCVEDRKFSWDKFVPRKK